MMLFKRYFEESAGRIISIGFVFFVTSLFALKVQAQEQWEKEGAGEIKDVQYEIIVNKKIILPRANRNFEKVPPRPYEPIKPAITYELKNFKFTTPAYKPVIRPLKVKDQALSKIYGNYVSAGFGNYGSIFLEGSATTKRDKARYMGAHFYHRSFGSGPIDDKNSAGANSKISLFGKSMGKDVTLSGEANYENKGTYFYGYNPGIEVDRDKIRQEYNIVGLSAGIENTKPDDLNYNLKGGFSFLADHYKATETEATVSFNSTYDINETRKFILSSDYFLITRKDSAIAASPRHLFRVKPAYQFAPVENLLLTIGVNLAFQNDQYTDSKDFHFYPNVKAQYQLSSSIEAYGLVTGDIDKVSLHTLSAENLWVDSNIPISHTNRALEFRGGLNGKLGRKVSMGLGFSLAALKNLYFYENTRDVFNPAGISAGVQFDKFNVVYDKNTKRFNPFAEFNYAESDVFNLTVRADYFNYDTDILLEAWHRPEYRFSANTRFNLYEKITVEGGFIAQGGMKSFDPGTSAVISLDPAFDLNFKLRYFLSKQFSAFVQMNNMLSTKYPLYQSYPVRGFQVLGGISWSF